MTQQSMIQNPLCRTRCLESSEAQEAADLTSIRKDLEQISSCAELISSDGLSDFDPSRIAFIDSAVIRYRRCFNKGLRINLSRAILLQYVPRYIEIHEYFYDLGNKHIAHSVSALDFPCAVVALDETNPDNPIVMNYGLINIRGSVNGPNLVMLGRLCGELIENYVSPRLVELMAILGKQVESLSAAQLRRLKPQIFPVNLDEKTIGKSRQRPGSRRQ